MLLLLILMLYHYSHGSLNFIDDQEIQLHHLGVVSSVNAWDPVSEEVVLEALEIVLNPRNYPLVIMCNLGRHRTGTIVRRGYGSLWSFRCRRSSTYTLSVSVCARLSLSLVFCLSPPVAPPP